ncbi:NepR family anti-sigma factor [Phenylobacterium sp.]|uniref:NepR family anti-sigma factor n=1 Tax=Phenylobacterium sp. TaxID=1871053 RepID=UPI0035AF6CD4
MSAGRAARNKAIDEALRTMYRTIAQRPLPDRLKSVLEQLDAADERQDAPALQRRRGG